MSNAISTNNLGKIYGRTWRAAPVPALKGVSFDVAEGEVFGFIGPNGAGKSTAIKLLTGALKPSFGSARIFGRSLEDSKARQGVGYVPENPSIYDFLSPLEILVMGLRMHRVAVDDEEKHCLFWLERFGLVQVARKMIRTFSKGMTQRVALAHALAIKPRLLILDEPLSGLDPIGRKDVVDILSEFRQGGGTIFLTSHVLHDVERLADRFGLIHRGELKALKSPGELVQDEAMVTVRVVGELAPEGFSAETGGRWFAEVPRQDLWPILQRLQLSGHVLLEVRPTLTLERAFMRYVQDGSAS